MGVLGEVALDELALVAQRDEKVVESEVGVALHDVPHDGPPADLDHGFGPGDRLLGEAAAGSAGQYERLHLFLRVERSERHPVLDAFTLPIDRFGGRCSPRSANRSNRRLRRTGRTAGAGADGTVGCGEQKFLLFIAAGPATVWPRCPAGGAGTTGAGTCGRGGRLGYRQGQGDSPVEAVRPADRPGRVLHLLDRCPRLHPRLRAGVADGGRTDDAGFSAVGGGGCGHGGVHHVGARRLLTPPAPRRGGDRGVLASCRRRSGRRRHPRGVDQLRPRREGADRCERRRVLRAGHRGVDPSADAGPAPGPPPGPLDRIR